jgi:hypothetical protein
MSVLQKQPTGSGTQPFCHLVGNGAIFLEIKRPERDSDNSLPVGAVLNEWSYISIPLCHSLYGA